MYNMFTIARNDLIASLNYQDKPVNDQTVFVTLISTAKQRSATQLLIDSIRSFAGAMRNHPVWAFTLSAPEQDQDKLRDLGAEIIPLSVPDSVKSNWFAGKVCACARAEELAGTNTKTMIWISSDCLVIQPPVFFELGSSHDAAFRPVHIRNIGLLASQPLDEFWKRVYQAVGVDDVATTVESFVDNQQLRAYYNTHAFAIDLSHSLMREWYEIFERLVQDRDFQSGSCRDDLHQIFLHQAVLSALIASRLDHDRVHNLPPAYTYPYNLQEKIPADKRASLLNDLVCIAYEDRSLNPGEVNDIRIDDPLKSWLAERYTRRI
jgi:hypothetical protein